MLDNTIELLSSHLKPFGCTLVENDPSSGRVTHLQLAYEHVPDERDPSCLYQLDVDEESTSDLLQIEGNYLVVGEKATDFKDRVGPRSNVLFVRVSDAAVYRSVSAFFAGLSKAVEISPRLLGALVGPSPVQGCVEAAADFIENPIGLWTSQLNLRHASDRVPSGSTIWDKMVIEEISPYDLLGEPLSRNVNEVIRGFDYPTIQDVTSGMQYRSMALSFMARNHARYYLFALESRRKFTETDRILFYVLSQVLAIALGQERGQKSNDERLSDLVAFALSPESTTLQIDSRAREVGIAFPNVMRAVVVQSHVEQSVYMKHPNVIRLLRKTCPGSLVAVHKTRVVAVLDGERATESALLEQLGHCLEENGCIAAVSLPFSDSYHIRRGYRQCRAALELSPTKPQAGPLLRYEDYSLLDLLDQASASIDLSSWILPCARAVRAHDMQNATAYEETLRSFISHRDLGRVADELFVHRNTAAYRIRRCEELFGIDLDDGTQLEQVALSFAILDVTNLRTRRS